MVKPCPGPLADFILHFGFKPLRETILKILMTTLKRREKIEFQTVLYFSFECLYWTFLSEEKMTSMRKEAG